MSKFVLYAVRLVLALAVIALVSQTYLLAGFFAPATKTILTHPFSLFFVVEAWLYGFQISSFFGSVSYDGAYQALIVILLALIVLKFRDGFRMVK